MKMIKRILSAVSIALAASGALVSQAMASPVVYVDPMTQDTTGPTASVSIWVKDLTTDIAAVGLQLQFNSLVLSGLSWAVDPDDKMGVALDVAANDASGGFIGAGVLDLFFGADLSLDAGALALAEGSSFKLATVTFNTLGLGLSNLTIANLTLSNFAGTAIDATTQDGSICVKSDLASTLPGQGCQVSVPEPGSALLAAIALGGLALTRRRQKAA